MVTNNEEMIPEVDDKAARVEPLIFDLLAQGLSVEFKVTGSSMAPLIRGLDVISVAPVNTDTIRSGDVIAWKRGRDHLVVHRVISVGDHSVATRGDAANCPDGPTSTDQIVGKVVNLTRNGQPIHLGLGPERICLAWLSRHGWLSPILKTVSKTRKLVLGNKGRGRKPHPREEAPR